MDQPEPRRSNRRLALRRFSKRGSKVTCRKGTLGLGPNIGIRLVDLSETGVQLIVKTAVEVGAEVEVGLSSPGSVREIPRKGKVVWAGPISETEHCIGVHFDNRLDWSTVLDLGTTR